MDKIISFFILVAIIVVLISEILPIIAIVVGIAIFCFAIYFVFQNITEKRRTKRESIGLMTSFLATLSSKSNLAYDEIKDVESGKLYVEKVFNDFINSHTIPPRITHLFKELCGEIQKTLASNTLWISSTVPKSLYEISGSSLSRSEISITTDIPITSGLFNSLLHIVLSVDSSNIILTPLFIIYIKEKVVSFINWDEIDACANENVRVKEDAYSYVKGAHVLYQRYLHERVNGGPDRRYNYNPSWSVNQYGVFDLTVNKKVLKLLGTIIYKTGARFSKFDQFKKSLTINPIIYEAPCSNINIDIPNTVGQGDEVQPEEYATIFKQIIDERGKDILKERLFLSLLADYKVFKEKRFLRPFLETMTEEGYWSELTEGSPSVDTLNKIKKKFTTIHLYPEHEAAEAISYIGYGLGITA